MPEPTAPSRPPLPSLPATLARVLLDAVVILFKVVGALFVMVIALPLILVPVTLAGPILLIGFLVSIPFGGMYRSFLTWTYLRYRLSPLFAAVVTMLCTAMVIIVISVMGGFLDLMRVSARSLTSDVIVASDVSGFAHYEELAEALEKLPQVDAVTPTIQGFGLVKLIGRTHTVEVLGIDGESADRVFGYGDSLYWDADRILDQIDRQVVAAQADGMNVQGPDAQRRREVRELDLKQYGLTFKPPPAWGDMPGAVPGIEINRQNRRDDQGNYYYDVYSNSLGREMVLTVVPITEGGALVEPAVMKFLVVNEFKSGLHEVDANRVYVPFDVLQRMLKMDAAPVPNPETGEPTGEMNPARTSRLLVRGAPGVPLAEVRAAVDAEQQRIMEQHDVPFPLMVFTWEQQHAVLLSAVENEKGLISFLFGIMILVSIVVVGITFYNFVLEKTRDIGILRAMGASSFGVANVFMGYGLMIGVVGALAGLGMAVGIVYSLNEINDLLYVWFDRAIWNPQTYYFDEVPEQINAWEATLIVVGAIMSCVLGAVIPAIIAARQDPVQTLRYE